MRAAPFLLSMLAAMTCAPALATTFMEETVTCPIGGETFEYQAMASTSSFGAMLDGMPIGPGPNPYAPPICPTNKLVMYRDFTKAELETLTAIIAKPDYVAAASSETPHYLIYRLARALGDAEALPWVMLSATWEAKNAGEGDPRVARYNGEFVALVLEEKPDSSDFRSIALRARAANALRELGRFDEAEALRKSIVIAPDAGGADDDARANREGWSGYLTALAAPIAARDARRIIPEARR